MIRIVGGIHVGTEMPRLTLTVLTTLMLSLAGCDETETETRRVELADFCTPADEGLAGPDDLVVIEPHLESTADVAYVCAPEDYAAYLQAGGTPAHDNFRFAPMCLLLQPDGTHAWGPCPSGKDP